MVLRFQLNTICTCSLTRYVQRYTEFENYSDICAHAPDCIVRQIWIIHNLLCMDFVCMCSCSDTGNTHMPYNSPGVYLVHILSSQ